jgi:hypothetical protein
MQAKHSRRRCYALETNQPTNSPTNQPTNNHKQTQKLLERGHQDLVLEGSSRKSGGKTERAPRDYKGTTQVW